MGFKGLFQQGISESGVATAMWAVKHEPAAQAKRFAETLNCPTGNSTEMVACLRGKAYQEIIRLHDMAVFKVSLIKFALTEPRS